MQQAYCAALRVLRFVIGISRRGRSLRQASFRIIELFSPLLPSRPRCPCLLHRVPPLLCVFVFDVLPLACVLLCLIFSLTTSFPFLCSTIQLEFYFDIMTILRLMLLAHFEKIWWGPIISNKRPDNKNSFSVFVFCFRFLISKISKFRIVKNSYQSADMEPILSNFVVCLERYETP